MNQRERNALDRHITGNYGEHSETVEIINSLQYEWCIHMKDGETQRGVVDSFEEAQSALSAWHGDGTLQDVLHFAIYPKTRKPEETVHVHQYGEKMHRSCGAYICSECGHHKGLARCFCGWSESGNDGRVELQEMGETIDPEEY